LQFPDPLVRARFIRREKRFLVHVRLSDGSETIAHTNNTGRMTGCLWPDAPVWLSPARNPARKLRWTLELVELPPGDGALVGVNTALANVVVGEALAAGRIPSLAEYRSTASEVRYGQRNSRVDFLLTDGPDPELHTWLEVKNVSLVEAGLGRFPDAPSERGRKHLRELMDVVAAGQRAALVFCVQRDDARGVGPADSIDPDYGHLLREAASVGVELHGLQATVTTQGIWPGPLLPVRL